MMSKIVSFYMIESEKNNKQNNNQNWVRCDNWTKL